MTALNFNQINQNHKFVGGKAYNLAILSQQNFPVPNGLILTQIPESDTQWKSITDWWKGIDCPPLAVRSSASDEDDEGVSFAGQNSTFLNVKSEEDLKLAIKNCFESINKESSQFYREHFLGSSTQSTMNILIQEMVDPMFAGVYFSKDPRGQEEGDLIEYVEGLGESLVSGEKTPFKINKGVSSQAHTNWKEKYTTDLMELGPKVRDYLNKDIDMEWAIDKNGKLHLLQARPITATYAYSNRVKVVTEELARLKNSFSEETSWDGPTFSEWSGIPSYLTFSIWEKAFKPGMSFDDALKKIGYRSFVKKEFSSNESILNRVFGRPYINLDKMLHLYFGPIPYRLVALPRPHLKFDFKRIDFSSFIRTPLSIWNMIKVGWGLSSKRRFWQKKCYKELSEFKHKMDRPLNPGLYKDWDDDKLIDRFSKECYMFSKHSLLWPFVLIILTESTLHSLEAIIENVFGKEKSKKKLKHWMSVGLKTATFEMNNYFIKASEDTNKRPFFMSRYGHRGAGELELSNPRWVELGEKIFFNSTESNSRKKMSFDKKLVSKEINELKTFKKTIILQEWKLLKSMLELRELWKMEILKPFAHIRFIAEELGRRNGLKEDIYYLSVDEIVGKKLFNNNSINEEIINLIKDRKSKEQIFKLYSLPPMVTLKQAEELINGNRTDEVQTLDGESLSPGLSYGTVKVIENINKVDYSSLPEDFIIVAESTDPGWTPLFAKSKGIIVEKGGILSHSAIVARELGIPAISGIRNCTKMFKDGERICLDGNNGHISYD